MNDMRRDGGCGDGVPVCGAAMKDIRREGGCGCAGTYVFASRMDARRRRPTLCGSDSKVTEMADTLEVVDAAGTVVAMLVMLADRLWPCAAVASAFNACLSVAERKPSVTPDCAISVCVDIRRCGRERCDPCRSLGGSAVRAPPPGRRTTLLVNEALR
jgi:hypothetical protein